MQGDIKAVRARRRVSARGLLRAVGVYGAALVLVTLAVVLSIAAWRMYGRMALASEGESAAKAQLARVQTQQGQVSSDLQDLSTPIGIEGELRRRYGVAKPGEGVIRIVDASQESTSTTTEAQADGFWSRIWHVFFPGD